MSEQRPPILTTADLADIALQCYGLKLDLTKEPVELNSYEDRVFAVSGTFIDSNNNEERINGFSEEKSFILKIYGKLGTSRSHCIERMFKIMTQCNAKCKPYFRLSQPIQGLKDGKMGVLYKLPKSNSSLTQKEEEYLIRLTPFLPGGPVDVITASRDLLFEIGQGAARLDQHLKNISEKENDYERSCPWNLIYALDNLFDPYVNSMHESKEKKTAIQVLEDFKNTVQPILRETPKQWIHGDLSDQNIIVKNEKLIGFIDCDMMVYSYRVVDIAILMAYTIMAADQTDCIRVAKLLYQGYKSISPLDCSDEMNTLYTLMLMRFIQSLCIGRYISLHEDPDNEYLLNTTNSGGWDKLYFLIQLGKEKFMKEIES